MAAAVCGCHIRVVCVAATSSCGRGGRANHTHQESRLLVHAILEDRPEVGLARIRVADARREVLNEAITGLLARPGKESGHEGAVIGLEGGGSGGCKLGGHGFIQ